jgi:hypothetical protein
MPVNLESAPSLGFDGRMHSFAGRVSAGDRHVRAA